MRRRAAALLAPLAAVAIAVDAYAFWPAAATPLPRLSGQLVTQTLPDGTLLISREDWESGTYPIGRPFVPALP
jgi:hypothetical protein